MPDYKKQGVRYCHLNRFQIQSFAINDTINNTMQDNDEIGPTLGEQKGHDISRFYRELVGEYNSGAQWASSLVKNEGALPRSGPAGVQDEPLPQIRSALERPTSSPRSAASPGLSRNNVGWRLLQKAGWKVGQGLGAQEQGRKEPLQPEICQGSAGLGYKVTKKRQRTATNGAEDTTDTSLQSEKRMQRQKAVDVDDPLANEDIKTKVKRVKQVLEAEADQKVEKAIARMVYSAFKSEDASTRAPSGQHPRSRRITATNPLL
jgi:hypothetical protein